MLRLLRANHFDVLDLIELRPSPGGSERVGQVRPEILDVFDAHTESEQAGREVFLAGDGRSSFDRRLDRTEAGRVADQFHPATHGVRRRGTSCHIEGDDAAEV